MARFTVHTDGFCMDNFEADGIDDAIEQAFDGEGLGKIVDVPTLLNKFARYVRDGGWCRVECNGKTVISIGKS